VLRDHSQHRTAALKRETGGSYTRKEVCRLLKIDGRQLRSWERQQLVPELSEYRFSDLLGLKTVIRLRKDQVHPRVIKQTLNALKERLKDLPHLSEDVRVYKEGSRVRVQIGKQKMEPVSGQLLFDFAEHEISKLLQLPPSRKGADKVAETLRNKLEADRWFECGLELEQRAAPYQDPHSAGALVNLGTVFFNGHAWANAEKYYQKALEIDPNYPLAHFNLANLYDERGDTAAALLHYEAALKIYPSYADAHYNIALLHQSLGDVMKAVRHWRAYIKLDGNSNWAQIARRELTKLEAITVVPGTRPSSTKMHLVKSDKA
jgi:tetratricopeptide (TPR) repeat protein